MPELRDDPVTGRRVLLAPGRAARPHTVAATPPGPSLVEDCPFCPGNEHDTPPERCRTGAGDPDTPGWRVRVVPNLYPIVGGADAGPGAHGAHEVVVMGPDHSCDLARLDDAGVEELFWVLRERARVHVAAGFAHVQALVNHGRAAGASIAHPHAQVLAIEFVPPLVREVMGRFAAAASDIVAADFDTSRAKGGAVIADGSSWAWCPWAAASPYETRVSAPDAGARFDLTPDGSLAAVARATRDVVAALARVLGDAAYNVVVHDAPAAGDAPYHWYLSVVPRVSILAGFELGTGVMVNTVPPDDAAERLRQAIAGADAA